MQVSGSGASRAQTFAEIRVNLYVLLNAPSICVYVCAKACAIACTNLLIPACATESSKPNSSHLGRAQTRRRFEDDWLQISRTRYEIQASAKGPFGQGHTWCQQRSVGEGGCGRSAGLSLLGAVAGGAVAFQGMAQPDLTDRVFESSLCVPSGGG